MARRGSRTRGLRGNTGWARVLVAAAVVLAVAWWQWRPETASPWQGSASQEAPAGAAEPARGEALPAFLPAQARQTLALIARGGPFPHPQDGGVFGNYEGHLPAQPRGWYHEYTVDTPGLSHRGTRRIITGGTPPQAYWYSDDHYASFRPFQVPAR